MRFMSVFFLATVLSLALQAADPALDRLVVNDVPRDSKVIPGYVVFANAQVVWEVDATQVVSVHRTREEATITIVTVSVPLVPGRTHTQVVIPEAVLPYKDVLRVVQNLRFKPKE
jgi:hypothetical protein